MYNRRLKSCEVEARYYTSEYALSLQTKVAASAHLQQPLSSTRKLQQTPSTNPFPLDFNKAGASFVSEFTDEYNVAKMFQIPDTYGYQDLFEELFKLFGTVGSAGVQRVYDGPLATVSPLAG